MATPSAVVYFEYIRQLEFHRITILTRFVIFVFVFYETVLFFVVCGGLVSLFLCCTLSGSVSFGTCVQSGRVEMGRVQNYQYGGNVQRCQIIHPDLVQQ